MEENKLRSYFGFAIKSNSAIFGADSVVNGNKKVCLVAVSEDINETSMKRLRKKCENQSIILLTFEKGKIADYTHRENCKCVGVTDKNLAAAIINVRNK